MLKPNKILAADSFEIEDILIYNDDITTINNYWIGLAIVHCFLQSIYIE